MSPQVVMDFKDGGGVVNYYVSDAALARLKPASRPAAWLVLDRADRMSPAERQRLTKIAPVLTSLDAARNFPNAPLALSGGLTGSGFYDQNGRLIVTATNRQASDCAGSLILNGLPDGHYTATDLFTKQTLSFDVASHRASVPITVTRWDTRVFAISR